MFCRFLKINKSLSNIVDSYWLTCYLNCYLHRLKMLKTGKSQFTNTLYWVVFKYILYENNNFVRIKTANR